MYSGSTCEDQIQSDSACASQPCKRPQLCVPVNSTSYLCQCPPHYTGRFCDQRILACDSKPCVNGGFCLENSKNNSFNCVCPLGFTGIKFTSYNPLALKI